MGWGHPMKLEDILKKEQKRKKEWKKRVREQVYLDWESCAHGCWAWSEFGLGLGLNQGW